MSKKDDEEIDAMEQTGRHVVEEVGEKVDAFIELSRQVAHENDAIEDGARKRYFDELNESRRAHEERIAAQLRGARVSEETIRRLFESGLPEVG